MVLTVEICGPDWKTLVRKNGGESLKQQLKDSWLIQNYDYGHRAALLGTSSVGCANFSSRTFSSTVVLKM